MVENSLVPSHGVLPAEADAIESLARRAADEARALTGCEHVIVYRYASEVASVIAESSAAPNDDSSLGRTEGTAALREGARGLTVSLVVEGKQWGALQCRGPGAESPSREVSVACGYLGDALSARIEARLHSEALERLNDELRASSLAKDEFLATVSHELRTPLNAMLGWLRLLQSGQVPEGKTAQAIETVARNARSQAQLVEDLLDVSRITSGKMRIDVQTVDPLAIVEAAMLAVHPAAHAKDIRIHSHLDPTSGPISADPQRLQQIVWNLLANAVKFTPKNGRVDVRLERVGASIEIGVTDTGPGISSEFLPYVFDRFRQSDGATTRHHKGLGLGLAIAKHLVELHGGSVFASSAGAGQGASFVVRLPASGAPQVAALPVVAERGTVPAPAPQLAGLRVLVVDDEPDAVELLITLLTSYGVQVTGATSAAEALELITVAPPDILVSDVGMPGMDGFELIRRVRELPELSGARVPAVALTAFARTQDRSQAFLSGFDVYLPKPVDPAELIAVLVSLVGRLSPGRLAKGNSVSQAAATPAPSRAASGGEAERPDGARAASALPSLSGVRLLVVEDDEDTREALTALLEHFGATVEVAGSAAEARSAVRAFHPDLLISDVGLPDEDGFALLRSLRAGGVDGGGWIPAVAMTGRASAEDARAALLAGFQLHVPKPIDDDAFVTRVAKLVGWSARRGNNVGS